MKDKINEYNALVKRYTPKTKKFKNEFFAFFFGGLVCLAGQALYNLYLPLVNSDEQNAKMLVSVTVVFLTALFTCFHLYEYYAKIAGGGSLVPISGFANSMVSPAIEFKSEGLILGTGAKMFSLAGPVIVYGTVASVVYGVIYWVINLF